MTNMNREIAQAREAGARALNSLRKAQSQLNSARNWGILDIVGGGWISTMIKHGKLDEARQTLQQAQWDLREFGNELRDVNMPDVQLGGFTSFADYFFDGLLADFMVQSKINDARAQVQDAINRVEALLRELRQY